MVSIKREALSIETSLSTLRISHLANKKQLSVGAVISRPRRYACKLLKRTSDEARFGLAADSRPSIM